MSDSGMESETEPTVATTRERVLGAAVDRFMKEPYDKATLRGIAGEAGVDVAYVHRLFGSKQELFGQVLSVVFDHMTQTWPTEGNFLESLVAWVNQKNKTIEGADTLDLFIHSLGNPEARAAIVAFIRSHILDSMKVNIVGPDAAAKAEQIFAFLIGSRIVSRFIGMTNLDERAQDQANERMTMTVRAICGD